MKWWLISDEDVKKIQNGFKTVVFKGYRDIDKVVLKVEHTLSTGLCETDCIPGNFKENENDVKTVAIKTKH